MPGVIELRYTLPIGQAIEEILIVLMTSKSEELANRVVYVPIT